MVHVSAAADWNDDASDSETVDGARADSSPADIG